MNRQTKNKILNIPDSEYYDTIYINQLNKENEIKKQNLIWLEYSNDLIFDDDYYDLEKEKINKAINNLLFNEIHQTTLMDFLLKKESEK